MSEAHPASKLQLVLRVAAVLLLLVGAGVAGFWVGTLLGPKVEEARPGTLGNEGESSGAGTVVAKDSKAPPVFFFAGKGLNEDSAPVAAELAMAAKGGIHQFVVPIPNMVPWRGDEDFKAVMDTVSRVLRADARATFLFYVDLNPDEEWLVAHNHGCVRKADQEKAYPSVACPLWRQECKKALEGLAKGIAESPLAQNTLGYILTALEEGHWVQPEGYERSETNRDGFRQWLEGRYVKEAELAKAWGVPEIKFAGVEIPAHPGSDSLNQIFLGLPHQRPVIDFQQYTSESVADTIAELGKVLRDAAGDHVEILATYGFSFELDRVDAGHGALGLLLNSDLSGFVSPVSYLDRGVGGVGAPMGPLNSALAHGKKWYLIDDTRTGVAWNPQTAAGERIRGLRAEDVFNVQRRNFCLAAVQGLGLIWADPAGEGWLLDENQWKLFSQMQRIYSYLSAASNAATTEPAANAVMLNDDKGGPEAGEPPAAQPSEPPREGETMVEVSNEGEPLPLAQGETELMFTPGVEDVGSTEGEYIPMIAQSEAQYALTVVLDESSRFHLQCGPPLHKVLVQHAVEAALRAGVATRFCLMQDVLDGFGDSTTVYMFLNAFVLNQDDRQKLHARLSAEHACAIWLYAPGYIDSAPDAANITATARISVAQFGAEERAGSTFELPGRWLAQNADFGGEGLWKPLFYIDDPQTDVLGRYKASKKVSLALRVVEEGWTSVYLADPGMNPALLCEMLYMLDQQLHFRPEERNFFDVAYAAERTGQGRLLAVHARQSGDRTISLNGFYHVQDLFESGTPDRPKESFTLPMSNGQTRLYQLAPWE